MDVAVPDPSCLRDHGASLVQTSWKEPGRTDNVVVTAKNLIISEPYDTGSFQLKPAVFHRIVISKSRDQKSLTIYGDGKKVLTVTLIMGRREIVSTMVTPI